MKKLNVFICILLLIPLLLIPMYTKEPSVVPVYHRTPYVQECNRPGISSCTPSTPFPLIGVMFHGKETLPLYGQRLNRDRWVYHTIIPVRYNGKDSLQEYGIDMISTGDNVTVDGHHNPYSVRLYK